MALLPTGSNKILELNTSEVNIVIKSKKSQTGLIIDQSSSVVIEGHRIKRINIEAAGICEEYEEISEVSSHIIAIPPIFFEQTDYEIIVKSTDGQKVDFWNENYAIREKIGPVIDGDNSLISGVINFDNMVGYSDLVIDIENKHYITIRIEVFPTKISYKEDYQNMIADISEMVCAAAIDFMQKTYQMFSVGETTNSVLAIYFQILRAVFNDYMNALKRITSVPHHKLVTEHTVMPQHKVKRTDRATEKWLLKHQEYVALSGNKIYAERVLGANKQITYDTSENRFVKFILKSTISNIEEFQKRYCKTVKRTEEQVMLDADCMIRDIRRVLNNSFLKDVTEYSAAQSMSLVFGMAPGYRELYKCYIMLQRSLSVNGDIFKISAKDTAQLYEYWCFIKLFSLLKKEYKLLSPDIIKVDNTGITVNLVKGKKSEVRFINPATSEIIKLVYNPGESKTQTVNQKPDNVLELEKNGADISYKYVFDAKYRIETDPSNNFYPDDNPGPKVDDINTMHRYRDSIVYENQKSRFTFEKTMFGAYILFPYDDEEKYKNHRFYKSIDSVNIGGLPFLPGATQLVQKLLSELISDSKESAFERTTLPRGIEEKLIHVDWDKRDVMIGTFRSKNQFDICFEKKFYYVPAKRIAKNKLPIHWVALYQTDNKFEKRGQIRYFGEVLTMEPVPRKNIVEVPMTRDNPEELYYKICVREWKDITKINETGKPIRPKESGFVIEFTNMFLLKHSEYVKELLFRSEEEYRLYSELKRHINNPDIEGEDEVIAFNTDTCRFVFADGDIVVLRDGNIVKKVSLNEFAKKPAQAFRVLKYAALMKQ